MQQQQEIYAAAVALIGRTGATEYQFRICDGEPEVYVSVAKWGDDIYETASSTVPYQSAICLAEQVVDGGQCTHCGKPSAVSDGIETLPFSGQLCWYQYNPEMKTFRRGCEGGGD